MRKLGYLNRRGVRARGSKTICGGGAGQGETNMKKPGMVLLAVTEVLLMAVSALAQKPAVQGYGRAVVTILPKHSQELPVAVRSGEVRIKVDGKQARITGWTPLRGANTQTQLVLLIDDSARQSLGTQWSYIKNFVEEMPHHTQMAIAYMEYGRAVLSGPLSSNPAVVLRGLHIPANFAYGNASPYFCLSNLAKHWPSQNRAARRVVLMITDGVDEYYLRYNPEDPYVLAAIHDSVRAGLIVYALYWRNRGFVDGTGYGSYDGQSLLEEVTQATGGENFWIGIGDPVTFSPFFRELRTDLAHQYELRFAAPHISKPGVEYLHLKVIAPAVKIITPQKVYVRAAS